MAPTVIASLRAAVISVSLAWGSAWAQVPSAPVDRVAWPLVDFLVFGDSSHGVQMLVSPNLQSAQGREEQGRYVTIMLEPKPLQQWAISVAALVDSFSKVSRKDQTPFATVILPGDLGRAGLRLLSDPARNKKTPFYLEILDSVDLYPIAKTPEWFIAATRSDVLALLTALDAGAQQSAYDTTTRPLSGRATSPSSSDPFDSVRVYQVFQLERRPSLSRQWQLQYPEAARMARREGRVWLQFVIDTSGVIERESLRILMSDGEDFTQAALKGIDQARYQPAMVFGRPVRVMVWQPINFTLSRH